MASILLSGRIKHHRQTYVPSLEGHYTRKGQRGELRVVANEVIKGRDADVQELLVTTVGRYGDEPLIPLLDSLASKGETLDKLAVGKSIFKIMLRKTRRSQ